MLHFFKCKIYAPTISIVCPWHIHVVSGHRSRDVSLTIKFPPVINCSKKKKWRINVQSGPFLHEYRRCLELCKLPSYQAYKNGVHGLAGPGPKLVKVWPICSSGLIFSPGSSPQAKLKFILYGKI